MMRKLIVIALVLLNVACHAPKNTENCHYSIGLKNKTDRALFVNAYSDTILKSYMDPRNDAYNSRLLPYAGHNNVEIGDIHFIRNCHPICIEDLVKQGEKFHFFVYDSIKLGNKKWDSVQRHYLIAKRFDLTLNDLKKMNWVITYDGK